MYIRRGFLPRSITDFGCFLLLFIFIPISFVFQMAVVLPEFHSSDSMIFLLTWVLGVFVLSNVVGNIFACMLVDTSIKSVFLTPPRQNELLKNWNYCSVCETLTPPRTWHCPTCNTCILKRDHHCFFTGYCVGHQNHRFFLYFLLYTTIGAAYIIAYSSAFLWWKYADTFANRSTALKMIVPLLMLSADRSLNNLYLFIYELNIIAFAYSFVLIVYHTPNILRGRVAHERQWSRYDLGDWRSNLKMILGVRMHLTWISPLIRSDLPHNGVDWDRLVRQSSKRR